MTGFNESDQPTPTGASAIYRRRLAWILAFLLVWGLIFAGRFLYLLRTGSRSLPVLIRQREWHTATLPTLRGRILDRNGIPLAWSERWHCLIYDAADTHDTRWRDMYMLQDCLGVSAVEMFGKVDRARHRQVLLIWGLPAGNILKLKDLLQQNPRFRIETRFVRRYNPLVDERLRRQLGRSRQFGWREVGLDGWEAHFDRQLRGQDGKYRVQVNPDGSWHLESWEELRVPEHGFDVYLPFAVSNHGKAFSTDTAMAR